MKVRKRFEPEMSKKKQNLCVYPELQRIFWLSQEIWRTEVVYRFMGKEHFLNSSSKWNWILDLLEVPSWRKTVMRSQVRASYYIGFLGLFFLLTRLLVWSYFWKKRKKRHNVWKIMRQYALSCKMWYYGRPSHSIRHFCTVWTLYKYVLFFANMSNFEQNLFVISLHICVSFYRVCESWIVTPKCMYLLYFDITLQK